MQTIQKTKDGLDELDPEIVFKQSEKEEENDEKEIGDDEIGEMLHVRSDFKSEGLNA